LQCAPAAGIHRCRVEETSACPVGSSKTINTPFAVCRGERILTPLGSQIRIDHFRLQGTALRQRRSRISGRSFHTTRRRGRCCKPTSSFQACPAKPTRRSMQTAALFRSYRPVDANLQTVRAIAAVVRPKPEAQRHRTGKLRGRMSAIGAKRTYRSHSAMSGFGGKADIRGIHRIDGYDTKRTWPGLVAVAASNPTRTWHIFAAKAWADHPRIVSVACRR
jgi:hypothetical protein